MVTGSMADKLKQDEEASLRQEVEKLLRCPVCKEIVTDPKMLPCGEFSCSECIKLLRESAQTEEDVREHKLAVELLRALERCSANTSQKPPHENGDVRNGVQSSDSDNEDSIHEEANEMAEISAGLDTAAVGQAEGVPESPKEDVPAAVVDGEPVEAAVVDGEPVEAAVVDGEPAEAAVVDGEPAEAAVAEVHSNPDNNSDNPLDDTDPVEPADPESVKLNNSEPDEQSSLPPAATDDTKTDTKTDTSETQDKLDEVDRRMKPSEIKPLDAKTPPISIASSHSMEQNVSAPPSDTDDSEINVKLLEAFTVEQSASHIEVANKNRIYVTRWTYDDSGAITTFDGSGNKVKFIKGSRHNYSGITLSKLGYIFALNTSKHRIEEYNGANGKAIKYMKLDLCRDPQAIDMMPSGEVLVVDQEGNAVILYPNVKSGKPKVIKHEEIREPYDIACVDNAFYVTCAATKCVLKMSVAGELLWSYGTKSTKGKLKKPQGVCTDEDGKLYVVDANGILVFSEDGELEGRLYEKQTAQTRKPWYISVRDGLIAVLCDRNVVKLYQRL